MSQLIQGLQRKFKDSSGNLLLLCLRLFSGFVVGLVLAIAGQEIIGFGHISYWFVLVMGCGLYMRATKKYAFGGVLTVNLVLVLVGLLLRMYVLIAPGA